MRFENIAENGAHFLVKAGERTDYHAGEYDAHTLGFAELRAGSDADIILERVDIVLTAVDPLLLTGQEGESHCVCAYP